MQEFSAGNRIIRIKPLQLIGIIAILQFIISFFTVPMILTFDESIWQYIGRNWFRNGLVPYAGGVDNKSPLIFMIFGASDWLFGTNFWFPRLLGIFVESAGIFFLFKIAEKIINRRVGIFVISFYGLSLLWRATGGKYVSYTETYAITAILAAIYFSIVSNTEKRAFMGGIFAGLGFGFRLSAGFGILPILIFTFRKSHRTFILFSLGLFTGIIILVLIAALAGIHIREFLFYGFADNFGTGSPTAHSPAWKAQAFADGFFYSELLLFYPAVFCYFILTRKIDFLKVWLISEFTGIVILGMYDKSHFKNLLPVMSLMAAFVVNYLLKTYKMSAGYILLGIWILFFPKTFEPLFALKKLLILKSNQPIAGPSSIAREDENSKKEIGLWIRANTAPGEKIYVAGYGAQIQAYSERMSPSIYFNVTQTAYARKRLFADLISNKPALIVVPLSEQYSNSVSADIRSFIDKVVDNNYKMDTSVYNYNVFRLK